MFPHQFGIGDDGQPLSAAQVTEQMQVMQMPGKKHHKAKKTKQREERYMRALDQASLHLPQRAGVKTVVGEKVLRAAVYRDGEHLPAYGVGGGGGLLYPLPCVPATYLRSCPEP